MLSQSKNIHICLNDVCVFYDELLTCPESILASHISTFLLDIMREQIVNNNINEYINPFSFIIFISFRFKIIIFSE